MTDDRPIPSRVPVVRREEPGEKWWCACGHSKDQPFCDGSHQGTGHGEPLCVKVEEERKVAWCTCKRTSNAPWCDGSHAQLG